MTKKSGYVSIFGKPNAGKSTLINDLLNFNLSIVNRKAQTTRNKIFGILTEANYQIIFIDTPGILEKKIEEQSALGGFMMSELRASLNEADLIVHIIDATKIDFDQLKTVEETFKEVLLNKKRIIALNKIDLIKKDELLPLIDKLNKEFKYDDIVPVSALEKENIEELKKVIVKYLPEGEFYFDTETLTDKPEKFFVCEIIREKILSLYHDEIPYSVLVNILEFKERSNNLVYINAEIILERETQKAIVIGKKGEGLKKLGASARKDIENFLNKKVYLELFVKVRKDWKNNKKFIRDSIS